MMSLYRYKIRYKLGKNKILSIMLHLHGLKIHRKGLFNISVFHSSFYSSIQKCIPQYKFFSVDSKTIK